MQSREWSEHMWRYKQTMLYVLKNFGVMDETELQRFVTLMLDHRVYKEIFLESIQNLLNEDRIDVFYRYHPNFKIYDSIPSYRFLKYEVTKW